MLTQTDLIKKHRLMVRGNLGQHILADANVAQKIVDALDLQKGDHVLEIGPGLGALTLRIFEHPIHYTAVEKDIRFIHIMKEETSAEDFHSKVLSSEWVHNDILKTDLNALFKKSGKQKFKVISNLPYYITAPIIFKIMDSHHSVSLCVLMMQKEVGDRLHAEPGNKDYGRLSLAIQYAAEVGKVLDVSRGCFTPKPRVDSSVIAIRFKAEKPLSSEEEEKELFAVIKIAFSQRRKTLANLLVQNRKVSSRTQANEILKKMGLNSEIRGEKLSLKDFLVLSENLREKS